MILSLRKSSWSVESIFYMLVSAVALAVDCAVLRGAITLFGLHYLWAVADGFVAGSIVNYVLSTRWVFSARKFNKRRIEFAIFFAVGVFGLMVNECTMFFSVGVLGVSVMRAKLLSAGLTYFANFSLRKWLLFPDEAGRSIDTIFPVTVKDKVSSNA